MCVRCVCLEGEREGGREGGKADFEQRDDPQFHRRGQEGRAGGQDKGRDLHTLPYITMTIVVLGMNAETYTPFHTSQ